MQSMDGDLEQQDSRGWTPIMWSSSNGYCKLVKQVSSFRYCWHLAKTENILDSISRSSCFWKAEADFCPERHNAGQLTSCLAVERGRAWLVANLIRRNMTLQQEPVQDNSVQATFRKLTIRKCLAVGAKRGRCASHRPGKRREWHHHCLA